MNVPAPSETVATVLARIHEAERRLGPWLEGLRERTEDPDLREFIDLWSVANQGQITRTRAALAWVGGEAAIGTYDRREEAMLVREFGLTKPVEAHEVSGVLWTCARVFAEAYERVLTLIVREEAPALADMMEFSREHAARVLDTIRALNEALSVPDKATV
jgi:hypothetical protein